MSQKNLTKAIIGSSGFIGGHLLHRYQGSFGYNRANISRLSEDYSLYETAIISAAPGAKWLANQDPKRDLDNILELIRNLQYLMDTKCILISTIDVFPPNTTFDENTPLPDSHPEAYGRHRGLLELELLGKFKDLHIVRLPGMYGPGLKKNLIFDLKNNRQTPKLNRNSEFQYFDVRDIPSTLELMIAQGIRCLNLATEPLSVGSLLEEVFGRKPNDNIDEPTNMYKMESLYSQEISGRSGPYHKSKAEIKTSIKVWVESDK